MIEVLLTDDPHIFQKLEKMFKGEEIFLPVQKCWKLEKCLSEKNLSVHLFRFDLRVTEVASRVIGGQKKIWSVAHIGNVADYPDSRSSKASNVNSS